MTAYNNMEQHKSGGHITTPRHKKIRVSPAPRSSVVTVSSSVATSQSTSDAATTSSATLSHKHKSSSSHHRRYSRDIEGMNKSAVAADFCSVFGVFFAVLVRVLLLAFCLLTVSLVVSQLNEARYWALASLSVLLVIEGIYTVVTRLGQERKWFCLCFACYLFACIPNIWILELERLSAFESAVKNSTVSVSVAGISAEIKLDPDLALNIAEQCLVFILIFCRWILPRGDISRDQLSQLLFVFIGMASDVMELFQLFDETEVRQERALNYAILAVWTLSLCQFTLVLTMSHSPKKARVATDATMTDQTDSSKESIMQKLTQTEMWSLVCNICMQDGPFLAIRLYVLVRYSLVNYTIVFFVCKNILVVCLLLYRLIVICLRTSEDDDDDGSERYLHDETDRKGRLSVFSVNGVTGTSLRHRNSAFSISDPMSPTHSNGQSNHRGSAQTADNRSKGTPLRSLERNGPGHYGTTEFLEMSPQKSSRFHQPRRSSTDNW